MNESDDRSILRRGWNLAAGAYVAVLCLAVSDLAALRRGSVERFGDAAVRSFELHAGIGWIAAAVCVLVGLIVGAPRAKSARFGILIAVLFLLSWPLSRSLATGGGIVRRGLGPAVEFGLPLAFSLLGGLWDRVLVREKIGRGGRITIALVSAIIATTLDERFFVGLYAGVHDALLFFALVSAGFAIAHMTTALRRTNVTIGIFGLAASAVALLSLSEPASRDALAIMENHGRTSARLERRLRSIFAHRAIEIGAVDDALVKMTLDYRAVAEAAKAEYGRRRPERSRANLVWISIDALRGDRPSAFGGRVKTPAIDALAARSAVFTRAYAQYPSTGFSVESMFRGRYPKATPIYRAMKSTVDPKDPAPNLPSLLEAYGFFSAASLAFSAEWLLQPSTQSHLAGFDAVNLDRRGAPELSAEYFVDSALASVRAAKDRRFFLWLHLFDPHHPYTPHDGLTEGESAEARYDGEIRYVDRELGRFFDEFRKLRGGDDTIVVLNSDHGEAFGEHGVFFHSTSLYDEQVRIPLIVHIPGTEPRRFTETVQNVDLMETVADALGLDRPFATQGRSLLPLILGQKSDLAPFPDFAYAELPDDIQEVDRAVRNVHMLVYEDKKILKHMDTGRIQLFDLASDPGEKIDRSLDERTTAARMEALLNGIAQWTENFGRTVDPKKLRHELIERLADEIEKGDHFRKAEAIGVAKNEHATELEDAIRRVALEKKNVEEVRYAAFDALLSFEANSAIAAVARDFSADGSAILRWAALRAVNGGRASALIGDDVRNAEETEPRLVFERAILRGESSDATFDAVGSIVPRTREIEKRRIFAEVSRRTGKRPLTSTEVDEIFSAGFTPSEEAQVARALAGDRAAFLRWLRGRAPDRYLAVDTKNFCLERFEEFDQDTRLAIGMHFLARWDPEFDRRARERLSRYFSAETIDRLTRLSAMDLAAREMGGEKKWADASDRFAKIAAEHPSRAGALAAAIAALDHAMATDDHERVTRCVEAVKRSIAAIVDPGETASAADLLADASELLENEPERGPASERDPVRVVGGEGIPETGAKGPERLAIGEKFGVTIRIENTGDRLYLSGKRKRGLVCRMLWKDASGGEYYGDVQPLRNALPKRSTIEESVIVEAPPKAGRWKVRPIIVEYPEKRFHFSEIPACDFEVDVVPTPGGSLGNGLRFSAAEIEKEWQADPTILEAGLVRQTDGTVYSGVSTFYRRGLTLKRLLEGDGREHRLMIRGRLASDLDGAHVVRVTLKRDDVVLWEKAEDAPTTDRGGMRVADLSTLSFTLPAFSGPVVLAIEPAQRPGFWSIAEIVIE